ncbi:MAG: hypothetical protein Q9M34_00255 [Sulfurimonas sp.]|nr:hypothetical protein [Sulfurimonas sp.]
MKYYLAVVLVMIVFSSCASHTDDTYYDRAHKASDKAQSDLQKENF